MAKWLAARGHTVTVLDSLATGHRGALQWGRFIEADLLDEVAIEDIFATHQFDAVMHFCAKSLVGESVAAPYDYYSNNVSGTLNLLKSMRRHGVSKLVFSSTAAVYGQPRVDVLDEDQPTDPINPYGRSKLMVEQILRDAANAYGLHSVSLRYFNAAGASPEADIGEAHEPETHLIPNVLRAALGRGSGLKIFGDDYPTPDGTCVRDYIHVEDLASAHELALDYMDRRPGASVFNLGSGSGFSVRQVIAAAERITGCKIAYDVAPRRSGDPGILVASNAKAQSVLGWAPKKSTLDSMIQTAWHWHTHQRF